MKHQRATNGKDNLVPRRTQFSSCDACRKSRVACDAMKGRSALTSPTWLNSCTRCLNRGRHCTFEWIEKATLPNSKRKYDAFRDAGSAGSDSTPPEAFPTPEIAVDRGHLSERQNMLLISTIDSPPRNRQDSGTAPNDTEGWLRDIYEGVFEDVFGSWLGSYSCPYVFRDTGSQNPKQIALTVSLSRLCQECDYWMKKMQGQGNNGQCEEGSSPGEIESDRQINHSMSRAISAFSARWLPLRDSFEISDTSTMDTVESLWREVRRDVLRIINRPCYRSALTLFLFALTPIPARVSEEEESDGIPAQACVQIALQQVLTLRALQKSLEFNGSKVSSISSSSHVNSTNSPTPVTKDFLGIESMIYWAAMTFDTSSSLTLNTKSLLSPGLSLGLAQESSWRLVRTCTKVFHEQTETWRAQGVQINEERANQIIASAASWKLFVWKAAALVKEALREGREEHTVQLAFDTALDAINQYNITYHDLLTACERRIQFFGHKTKLRWYELVLHYNLSILIMLDAVEIAGRMDLLEKMRVIKADAEGSLFNCLIFGLSNHFYVPRGASNPDETQFLTTGYSEETEREALTDSARKKVPLIAIDPYPHHVVAGVRILWKAVERNLENEWLDHSVAQHMQETMLNALNLLPQASRSVRTVRQQAEASFIGNRFNLHY